MLPAVFTGVWYATERLTKRLSRYESTLGGRLRAPHRAGRPAGSAVSSNAPDGWEVGLNLGEATTVESVYCTSWVYKVRLYPGFTIDTMKK